MANRINVKALIVVIGVALIGTAWWWDHKFFGDPITEVESMGQVIDHDTAKPIVGAIVVAKYVGGLAGGGTSCNRVESAVSNASGWFGVPVDPRDGPPILEAYHPEYEYSIGLRYAHNGAEGRSDRWRVLVYNAVGEIDHYEPKVFETELEAKNASGENRNVYLKRSSGDRLERIRAVGRLVSATSCSAPPKSSPGLVPFLAAILAEEQMLGVPPGGLESTQWFLEQAQLAKDRKSP